MSAIPEFLHKVRSDRKRIVVIGDILIDKYTPVKVTRLSPESPVPVLLADESKSFVRPGGAANTAIQLENFNVEVELLGFCSVTILKDQLETQKFHTRFCVSDYLRDGCWNPVKHRYFDEETGQVVSRIDNERKDYGIKDIREWRKALIENLRLLLEESKPDIVVCSDYGKGVFNHGSAQEVITLCHQHSVPCVVDSKTNVFRWQGCTHFKCNAPDAGKFFGGYVDSDQLGIMACAIRMELHNQSVLITDGGKGVFSDTFTYQPTRPTVVKSVVGAGDCFTAFLSLAITQGFSVEQAAEIAYEAGAAYVGKGFNEPIFPHELLSRFDPVASKIITPDNLIRVRELEKSKKWVLTNGCFDLLHVGHLQSLLFARSQGDRLIVAVNSDDSVKHLKGEGRPVIPWVERMRLLAGLECVDFAVPFFGADPACLIQRLHPDVLVKGPDWQGREVAGAQYAGKLLFSPATSEQSTSKIIEKICSKIVE